MAAEMDPNGAPTAAGQLLRQRQREAQVAYRLSEKLSGVTNGTVPMEEFIEKSREEAVELASAPFGASLLFHIGRVYCAMAERHLGYEKGFGLAGHRAAWKERRHALNQTTQALVDVAKVARAVHKTVGATEPDEDMVPDAEQIPQFLKVVFGMTVLDVENTLRKSCDLVLRDTDPADKKARQRRGEAMAALGDLFKEVTDGTDREARHAEAFDQMAEQVAGAVAAEQTSRGSGEDEDGDGATGSVEQGGAEDPPLVPPVAPAPGEARP